MIPYRLVPGGPRVAGWLGALMGLFKEFCKWFCCSRPSGCNVMTCRGSQVRYEELDVDLTLASFELRMCGAHSAMSTFDGYTTTRRAPRPRP